MGEWLYMCQSISHHSINHYPPSNHLSSCNHHAIIIIHHAITNQSLTIQSLITHHNHIHLQEHTN